MFPNLLSALQQPLHVVPVLSPSSSAPSSASPTLGKRASSPLESQTKKARLSPESPSKFDTKSPLSEDLTEATTSDLFSRFQGPVPDDTVFCSVPGRMAILNANTKYPVTVGEIKRRLANPERLNTSVMGGILRRAKAKNGGKELRELLEKMGLDLPMGKRKAIAMTLFTPMVEGEAIHLAKDFEHLCATEFPTEAVADHMTTKATGEEKNSRKERLGTAVGVLNELKSVLEKDHSPLMASQPDPVLPSHVQESLTHFSMCTHGFGTPALIAAVNTVIKIVESCVAQLEEPVQPPALTQEQMQWFILAAQMMQAAQQQQQPKDSPSP